MAQTSGGLQELHRIHTEIAELRTALDRGPRQIRAKRKLVDNKIAEIVTLRAKLVQARKAADEKSLQLKSNEAKLHGLQIKLNQAGVQREFDALKMQMDADRMANSVLEDEILEALDRVDTLQAEIKTAQHDQVTLTTEAERFATEVNAAEGGRKSALASLEKSQADAERAIPASLMLDYRRLVQAHGASSLAPVVGKACSSCMTTVTTQQAIDLRAGKFTFCRSCGRLLYQVE